MKCKNIPTVNMEGISVDSALFKSLFDYSKNREVTKRAYLKTKTESFKKWNPKLDSSGEALTFSDSQRMYFINQDGEVMSVFDDIDYSPEGFNLSDLNYEDANSLDEMFDNTSTRNFQELYELKLNIRDKINAQYKAVRSRLKSTDLTANEILSLSHKEVVYKDLLEGSVNKIGLNQEVEELKNKLTIRTMYEYANRVVDTVESLIRINDFQSNAIALDIASWFDKASRFNDTKDNPLFEREEIESFSSKEKSEIRKINESLENLILQVNIQNTDKLVNTVRNNEHVRNIFGDDLTAEMVLGEQGLQDITLFDSMFMDPMSTTYRSNGILPQFMMYQLSHHMNRAKSIIKDYEDRIEELRPNVEKIIGELDGGKYNLGNFGILGAKGISWEPFYEKDVNGDRTGGLINRFSPKWLQEYKSAKYNLNQERSLGYSVKNSRKVFKANEKYRNWIKSNTYLFDFTRSKNIINFINSHPILKELNLNLSTDNFITANDYGISDKHFNEIEKEQIRLLNSYANSYQAFVHDSIMKENAKNYESLTDEAKKDIVQWQLTNSPFYGLKNYEIKEMGDNESLEYDGKKTIIFNNFNYNQVIPKKYLKDEQKEINSGFYNEDFELFENNDDLYNFRNLAAEIFDYVSSVLPPEKAHVLNSNSIPLLHKNLSEILFDPSSAGVILRLRAGFWYIYDMIKSIFGIDQPGLYDNSTINPATGLVEHKVNAGFLNNNRNDISLRFKVEMIKFNNFVRNKKYKIENKYSSIPYSKLEEPQKRIIANYLNTNNISEENFKKILNLKSHDDIPVGRLLMSHATNIVVENKSFNLHKTLLMFSKLAADYDARQRAKPIIDAALDKYKKIKGVTTNRLDKPVTFNNGRQAPDSITSERSNSIAQMESWYKRSLLDDYRGKEYGITEKKIYTKEEKAFIKQLESLGNTDDPEVEAQLIDIKNNIGTNFTISRTYQGFLSFIRMKVLGWNIPSALTNYAEGQIDNELLAQTEEYFSLNTWYRARSIYTHGGKSNRAKMHALMERYDILQDSSNIFQKAGIKSSLNKFENLSPFHITRTIEYLNQSPLMVSLLMEQRIRNSETGEESSVWDAMDENGRLKEGFNTPENVQNWERLSGSQYDSFKSTVDKVIVKTHGDYQTIRGIRAKEGYIGKSLLTFKGWLPQLYSKFFAKEHFDIETGKPVVKGWYRSHTPVSGSIAGLLVGLTFAGIPGGLLMGAALGGLATINNVNTDINYMQELILDSKILLKKLYGIPLNRLTGKNIVNLSGTQEYIKAGFKPIDARNMQANMSQLALMTMLLTLSMLTKAFFWNDDDEKESARRKTHNLLMNELGNISGKLMMFVRPDIVWKDTITSVAALRTLSDLEKVMINMGKYVQNNDTIVSGDNAGESRLLGSVVKTFAPVPVRLLVGDLSFGFEPYMSRQFESSYLDYEFKSPEVKLKNEYKQKRAKRRAELFEAYDYTAKEVNEILREEGLFDY